MYYFPSYINTYFCNIVGILKYLKARLKMQCSILYNMQQEPLAWKSLKTPAIEYLSTSNSRLLSLCLYR